MKKFLEKLLHAVKNRKGTGEKKLLPFTTAEDWAVRLLEADEQSKAGLYQVLIEGELSREDCIFLIAVFLELDEQTIEIVTKKAIMADIQVSFQDLENLWNSEYWSNWPMLEYGLEFRKRKIK